MSRRIIFLVVCILLTSAQVGWAATVTLAWNASSEADLAGYRLNYGTAPRTQHAYTDTVVINDKYATSQSITLSPGTYYFALTAFDTGENESGFSTEVSGTVSDEGPPGKPGKPVLVP